MLAGHCHRPSLVEVTPGRLYLNTDLTHYLEFRKEDTVHAHQISPTRVFVWVRGGAQVQEVRTRSMQVEFLRGELIRDHLNRGTDVSEVPGLRRALGVAAAGCSAASCFTTAGPNCPGPEHPGTGGDTAGFTCGC